MRSGATWCPRADADGLPDPGVTYTLDAGQVTLRRDKRPRPLVLRVNAGDCLHVRFTNLLASTVQSDEGRAAGHARRLHALRRAGSGQTHPRHGLQRRQNPASGNGIVAPNGGVDYWLYAPKEGTYVFYSAGAMTGGEGDGGQHLRRASSAPSTSSRRARVWYRSQVTRDDLDLARTDITLHGRHLPDPQLRRGLSGRPPLPACRSCEMTQRHRDRALRSDGDHRRTGADRAT